jgi:hypothetical protein
VFKYRMALFGTVVKEKMNVFKKMKVLRRPGVLVSAPTGCGCSRLEFCYKSKYEGTISRESR